MRLRSVLLTLAVLVRDTRKVFDIRPFTYNYPIRNQIKEVCEEKSSKKLLSKLIFYREIKVCFWSQNTRGSAEFYGKEENGG